MEHDEKYLVIYNGEKIYLNADNWGTHSDFGIHRFTSAQGKVLAVFPIKFCAVILNNSSK